MQKQSKISKELGYKIILHPPIISTKRTFCEFDESRKPKPYLERNKDIVDESEIIIATPKGDVEIRSGTWSTIRYAKKVKRECISMT